MDSLYEPIDVRTRENGEARWRFARTLGEEIERRGVSDHKPDSLASHLALDAAWSAALLAVSEAP